MPNKQLWIVKNCVLTEQGLESLKRDFSLGSVWPQFHPVQGAALLESNNGITATYKPHILTHTCTHTHIYSQMSQFFPIADTERQLNPSIHPHLHRDVRGGNRGKSDFKREAQCVIRAAEWFITLSHFVTSVLWMRTRERSRSSSTGHSSSFLSVLCTHHVSPTSMDSSLFSIVFVFKYCIYFL